MASTYQYYKLLFVIVYLFKMIWMINKYIELWHKIMKFIMHFSILLVY